MELVELLHADGELTDAGVRLLRARGTERTAEVDAPKTPVDSSRGRPARTGARSVEELLRTYQITSLRQAGAVRARRQISFEEYMSLKRYYAPSEPAASDAAPVA